MAMAIMDDHGAMEFESKLESAIETVARVLHTTRHPKIANQVHHRYDDKFGLASWCTNISIASQLNCLSRLGLSQDHVTILQGWVEGGSSVSLRFRAEETCDFSCEVSREVDEPNKYKEEVRSRGRMSRTFFSSKVVTTITEYIWEFKAKWELCAVRGVGEVEGDVLVLSSTACEHNIKTSTKSSPRPEAVVPAKMAEVDITWLISQLLSQDGPIPSDNEGAPSNVASKVASKVPAFTIDRASPECKTPRRNPEVENALGYFIRFRAWSQDVCSYFFNNLFNIQRAPGQNMAALSSLGTVFVPTVPLFEEGHDPTVGWTEGQGPADLAHDGTSVIATLGAPSSPNPLSAEVVGGEASVCLGSADANTFLSEEYRSMSVKLSDVAQTLPSDDSLITTSNGSVCVVLRHCMKVCAAMGESLNFIEQMLRKQLVDAIGKHVTPHDFSEYMVYHNRKLFHGDYAPRPFSYGVRRTANHSPEGTLSILSRQSSSAIAEPIMTLVSREETAATPPMTFPISAAANVTFNGERYLHAHLLHTFSGTSASTLEISAQARQFSSMMVMVGTISSAISFEPKYAAIVQNKDELTIPLELSTIPTPKEFKEAVVSISPKQQAFAKMFRSMQLASTLFGVVVVQIKPALEQILNLPPDSLTKELRLTQDLMELFIEYQIPTDLLKYDTEPAGGGGGGGGGGGESAVAAVKGHVAAIRGMIDKAKKKEIEEARAKKELEMLNTRRSTMQASYSMRRNSESDSDCDEEEEEYLDEGEVEILPTSAYCDVEDVCDDGEEADFFGGGLENAMEKMDVMEAKMGGNDMVVNKEAAAPLNSTDLPTPAPVDGPAATGASMGAKVVVARDYTKVPNQLNAQFESLDEDNCLRPTIVKPGDLWIKKAQASLLAARTTQHIDGDAQKVEKDRAFALLDAITKSGALPLDHAQLHVVVAATHAFEKSVTETVIQDNMSPIEKAERSTLILAKTVHERATAELISPIQLERVVGTSPGLFLEEGR